MPGLVPRTAHVVVASALMGTTPPDSPPSRRPTRGVIVKYISANDEADLSLEELAYRTPRLPDGIWRNELTKASEVVQRETMLIWFLANYERTQEIFFEFAEA